MLRQLLLTGGGIGYLLLWLIEGDLATRRLVRLLPAYPDAVISARKCAA